jgi:multidrug resistance efflux pump
MKSKPLIPSPPSATWQHFLRTYVPWLTCILVTIATIGLWRQVVNTGTLAAVGASLQSTTTSPWAGILLSVYVEPYQIVNKGEPIAVLQPLDPRLQMDLLRSEVDLARLKTQPSIAEQNALDYERVRLDWLQLKAELAMARVNLARAEKDLRRNTPLFQEKLLSGDLYDLTVRDRDYYKTEVEIKSRTVAEIEERLEKLQGLGDPSLGSTNLLSQYISSNYEIQQSLLQTNLAPFTLVAPIDGMVTFVVRQANEYVVEGEALIGISPLWSERAVGYMRQPYPVDPQVGMPVQITTRSRQRQTFSSRISQVGGPLEYITNALAKIPINALVDVGLPVVVDLPSQAMVRPGEIVDVILLPAVAQSSRPVN